MQVKDIRNKEEVVKAIRASIMSKQYGNEDFIAGLVAEACISILPVNSGFNVDNIRWERDEMSITTFVL